MTPARLAVARRYIVAALFRIRGRRIGQRLRTHVRRALALYAWCREILVARMQPVPRCPYGCLEACMRPARCPCAGSRLAGAA